MIFDAHFHYAVCAERKICNFPLNIEWKALSCAHTFDEWRIQENAPDNIYKAFGIHPQIVGKVNIPEYKLFMEKLARENKLDAIGEAGFDFFTDEYKMTKEIQEDVWRFELELAAQYNIPLVVHCRKGNDKLFQYSRELKKIPAVLFHSFMGSLVEAESLINRNINCFFSFGKQLMNNNKKVIDCVKNLPTEHLLLETDAPFQTLKGEENTFPGDIIKIYEEGYKLRNESFTCISYDNFIDSLYKNSKVLVSTIQI